jgi:hypothetical protein
MARSKEVVVSNYGLRSKNRKPSAGPVQDNESHELVYKFGKNVVTNAFLNLHIDDGPQKPHESKHAWLKRVTFARSFMGVKGSELHEARRAVPLPTADRDLESDKHNEQMQARKAAISQCQKDLRLHQQKMNPGHRSYDASYAEKYKADKAARVKSNAQKRERALRDARIFAAQSGLVRPKTPQEPEDSSDEDIPQPQVTPGTPHLNSEGCRPPPRCNECTRRQKSCNLREGTSKPCSRCADKGIPCEDQRVAPRSRSVRIANVEMEVDSSAGMEVDSGVEMEVDSMDQQPSEPQPLNDASIQNQSPVEPTPCSLCQNNCQICDGERPCGSCIQNDVSHLCVDGNAELDMGNAEQEINNPTHYQEFEDVIWNPYEPTFDVGGYERTADEQMWIDEQFYEEYMSMVADPTFKGTVDDSMFDEFMTFSDDEDMIEY